jgi:predicted glycosyltransferase
VNSTTTSTSVLFNVRNRRGLGHLMRTANIGAALETLTAPPSFAFHLAADPPPELWNAAWPTTVESNRQWADVATEQAPDVVVYDTIVPPEPTLGLADETAYVFILRRRAELRCDELYNDPFLDRVDRFIVPHSIDEFGPPPPDRFLDRTEFVGPIARCPSPERVAEARQLHSRRSEFLLTSTVGGGGFGVQADRFFELVHAAVTELANTKPDLRHVVVLGPNYDNPAMARRLAALPATEVVPTSSDLVALLAASDLVIAEAGYNTVTELRVVGVPAVLVPSARGIDDQVERAIRLADSGCATVLEPSLSAEEFASNIIALANDDHVLHRMRAAAKPLALGNRRAAEIIAEVAACPR